MILSRDTMARHFTLTPTIASTLTLSAESSEPSANSNPNPNPNYTLTQEARRKTLHHPDRR